ncbi:hypothetical protein PACTADRAFT_52 [Pachysolen tannophilus NRRL Y-2460]|uniref:ATP-grasp domain-containing protein n=1 Tax=Pachysolen tannophilus NRRL Y-2460 TaxID=669874 RepID=A0A1E4U0S0_PACTA|nr:hypothetical protein PACTADRAFT_52 [Pachysolen tannophilus NRRL Y-2460]
MSKINVLVVGNGGREHALVHSLYTSPLVNHIYVAPGNGGTQNSYSNVSNVPIGYSPKDFPALVAFAKEKDIQLVIPGPEQPLVDGISTFFKKNGISVFGPSAKASLMEGSKTFSKDFMARHSIPTADFQNFNNYELAKNYLLKNSEKNFVIKASGIAAGKGVLIPTNTQEALDAVKQIMVDKEFGHAGDEVVIEEFLQGDELSILCLCDGYTIIDLPPAQDHKRIGDGDQGLNTGGMGAYAPAPLATPALLAKIRSTILKPTIDGMRKDGYPMIGCLFVGIMVSPSGEPKVLEYNVRFGDPETQTILPLIKSDLLEILYAAAEGRLDSVEVNIEKAFSTTVVMAAGGYPESYTKNDEITISKPLPENTFIFHAGTSILPNSTKLVTSGGRVIASTAIASTLEDSVKMAYVGVDHVSFKNKYNRTDIAYRAFKQQQSQQERQAITYADSGVSVDNGNQLVENIKKLVKSTARPGADSEIGGFGGLFDLSKAGYTNINETLLVGATDGVGTKLRIAQIMNIHNSVGIDLVAMNVNDLVVQGAEPLMFLDYFATGRLDIKVAEQFVYGVAKGCKIAGCALVGGETSEMPGMYSEGHYDTNGTAVGAVVKNEMLPKLDEMAVGDILIGLGSDGVHSNGFSLVRKIIEKNGLSYHDPLPYDNSLTIGEAVLVPTRIYVKQLMPSIKKKLLLGLAHITGGGLVENIPRALPSNLQAKVDMSSWEIPEIFKWFGTIGNVPVEDILKTFNMGIGMVAIVKPENADEVIKNLVAEGERVFKIGELVERKNGQAGCIVENAAGLY